MKFDKYPYVKRPVLEVFLMDWFLPAIVVMGFFELIYEIGKGIL